ncbi:hypothetical protein D3C81_1345910 [compost metagenome]
MPSPGAESLHAEKQTNSSHRPEVFPAFWRIGEQSPESAGEHEAPLHYPVPPQEHILPG